MKKIIKRYGNTNVIVLDVEDMKVEDLKVDDIVEINLTKVNK